MLLLYHSSLVSVLFIPGNTIRTIILIATNIEQLTDTLLMMYTLITASPWYHELWLNCGTHLKL